MKWIRLFFSPAGFLFIALLIAGTYHALDSFGWRTSTSALSGMPPAGTSYSVAVLHCGAYMIAYFAYVLLVPILALASVFMLLFSRP